MLHGKSWKVNLDELHGIYKYFDGAETIYNVY